MECSLPDIDFEGMDSLVAHCFWCHRTVFDADDYYTCLRCPDQMHHVCTDCWQHSNYMCKPCANCYPGIPAVFDSDNHETQGATRVPEVFDRKIDPTKAKVILANCASCKCPMAFYRSFRDCYIYGLEFLESRHTKWDLCMACIRDIVCWADNVIA